MNILIFNCGSSSLTYKVFEIKSADNIEAVLSGKAHRVGVKGSEPSFIENHFEGNTHKNVTPIRNHGEAAALALGYLKNNDICVDYIGNRFVHGGSYFSNSAFLSEDTLQKLHLCVPLAPIHNPVSLSVIYECEKLLPGIPQYVAFDSAFHSSIPHYAYTYALPKRVIQKFGFRKYGFHGLSYLYVSRETNRYLGDSQENLKIVACHLGTGGSSVAAIKNGHSIDTSMGYSPLPGLIMSTRSGDMDPMLTIYLMAVYGYSPDELSDVLNKKSGLLGISGLSSDIRDIIHSFDELGKEERAELAFNMYVHRLKKYIGSYTVALGGMDVLVFTDDIGVHNPLVREKVCENMEWCGLMMDNEVNSRAIQDETTLLSTEESTVRVLSVPTEEELVICTEGVELLRGEQK